MNNLEKRWIEIKFSMLCFGMYEKLHDYPFVVDYFQLLADLTYGKMTRQEALRILQKLFQANNVRPSRGEFVKLARMNKIPIRQICQTCHISKETYIYYEHNKDKYEIKYPKTTEDEIDKVQLLLDAHEKIRNVQYD